MTDLDTGSERTLAPGTKVEVRDAFEGRWNRGFVIEEVTDDGYIVRRGSDGELLPRALAKASVRRERRNSMWWI